MAKKVKKSNILAKLGKTAREAFDAHKDDPINFGSGSNLPPGIEGGVAKLVSCKFDEFASGDLKGEPYFRAEGIVVEPKVVDGVKIAGLRTSIMEPLCATPNRGRKTVEEHIEHVLNELKKLGVDTSEMPFDDLEDVAAALQEDGPYFRFRTWQGAPSKEFPNPRVQETWRGVVEYDPDAEEDDDVVEDEEEKEDEEEDTTEEDDDSDETEDTEEEETEEEDNASDDDEEEEEEEDEEEETLAERADKGDKKAQRELAKAAKAADIDPDIFDTWVEVQEAIDKTIPDENEEEEEDEEEEESNTPEKGGVYNYKPPKAKKPIEVEVTAVFERKQTVNVKSLDTGAVYKAIPWTALSE